MSRGLCRFGRFDLQRLPAGKRASALALQLPAWAPYADPDYAISWRSGEFDGQANVWCWDRANVTARLQAYGLAGRAFAIVPESALRPSLGDGVHLLRCIEGFEAQHWRRGELLNSRWWANQPVASAQLAFQRDCGLLPDELREDLPLQDFPLARKAETALVPAGRSSGSLKWAELATYGVLVLALGLPGLFMLVQQWRLTQARSAADSELAQVSERAKGILSAREVALDAADQVRALVDLETYPGPLVYMLAMARSLPEGGGSIVREWEMNEGKLRIVVASPTQEISGAEHVKALEQTGLFTDVKIITDADPRQMVFTMTLKPQAALAGMAASAVGEAAEP